MSEIKTYIIIGNEHEAGWEEMKDRLGTHVSLDDYEALEQENQQLMELMEAVQEDLNAYGKELEYDTVDKVHAFFKKRKPETL